MRLERIFEIDGFPFYGIDYRRHGEVKPTQDSTDAWGKFRETVGSHAGDVIISHVRMVDETPTADPGEED